ncbi:flagellar motor protein MotB [Candidatus Latescibacterota bacterium]
MNNTVMAEKKKPVEEPGPSSPLYMTTYGDMMTLLLCFFVLLLSMSSMEIEKFKAAAASLRGALSVLPFQERPLPQPPIERVPKGVKIRERRTRRSKAVSQLKRIIREKKLDEMIRVSETDQGVHIVISDPALFDTGKAIIKPEFYDVLVGIGDVIAAGTGREEIRVEGHTDNIPIHNAQYNDNWELSIARALSVIRFIRSKQKLDPRRLRPVGCGEYHPVATNDTPEGRSRNRRVEFFIDYND